jgi:hypothetical protein
MKRLIAILGLFVCAGCGEDRVVLYVGPERVPCTGVAEQQCLLVREDPDDDWEYFYDGIRGFDHEEGYEYTILVRRERVDPVAADASSIRYTLIRIHHREAVARTLAVGHADA